MMDSGEVKMLQRKHPLETELELMQKALAGLNEKFGSRQQNGWQG